MSLTLDTHLMIIFIAATLLGVVAVPGSIILASHFKIYSPIDFRRKNKERIPLLGGLAIFIAFTITSIFFPYSKGFYIALCGIPIVVCGILDDLIELSSKIKFLAQSVSVGLFLCFLEPQTLVLQQMGFSEAASFALTAFWMVGVVNAFNLIDGMDGLAGGTALIAATTFIFMTYGTPWAPVATTIAGASLAFLIFNSPPARIYLGDAGSTFLGFALASLASVIPLPVAKPLWLTAPLLVLALPQMDTVLAMYRRARLGISLFRGDHDHIHHKLLKIGLSKRRSLFVIYGVCIYASAAALAIFHSPRIGNALTILALTVPALCALLSGIFFTHLRLANQVSSYSQTLIQKYFQINHQIHYDDEQFASIVFDLLPYYKELQQRGILTVDKFISAFSRIVEKQSPERPVFMMGSYSVVIMLPTDQRTHNMKQSLINEFYTLIRDFEIVKNDNVVPEGVYYYSHEHKPAEFNLLMSRQQGANKPKRRARVA